MYKRSRKEDEEYEYEEEEDEEEEQEEEEKPRGGRAKSNTTTTKQTPKRKPVSKKPRKEKKKYEFTEEDKKVLLTAVKQHGTSYATIAKEYFSNRSPPVTRVDVQKFIALTGNAYLLKVAQTSMSFPFFFINPYST